MKRLLLAVFVATMVVVLAGGSFALARGGDRGKNRFSDRMDGWQEVASQVTTGEGRISLKINDASIDYKLSYEDLEGDTLFAHIHIGGAHENGPVSVFLCGGGGKPPCPARAGEVSGTITGADIQASSTANGVAPGEFADLVRAIKHGDTYANLHTAVRAPGGEIRADIDGRGKHHRH